MDQSIEAVIATMIFLGALTFSNHVLVETYSSILNREYEGIKMNLGSLVSSSIVIENACSYQNWVSWTPSSNPESYGLPRTFRIWINASVLSINEQDELSLIWSKCEGSIPVGGACEYDRLVPLKDGGLVLLRVVVG
ncbi:MAG: hypothetical protein ACUVQ5_00115 [Candidatus Methanomethylicaceae archaeon]